MLIQPNHKKLLPGSPRYTTNQVLGERDMYQQSAFLQYKLLLLFIIILISFKTYAQITIKGTVSSASGVKIAFATLSVYKDSTLVQEYLSDSIGNFAITLHTVQNGKLGIKAKFLNTSSGIYWISNDTARISLILEKKIQTLKEIRLTAAKPLVVQKADRYVFTPDKSITEGASGLDIVKYAPFVQVDAKSELFSIANKTGTIILINNKKSVLPKDLILEMLRTLPAENIKSIEIITNPGSEYDAGFAGGIININIRKFRNEGWFGTGTFQQSQSVYAISRFNGSANYHKNNLTLQVMPFLNNDYNYSTTENNLEYGSSETQFITARSFRRYRVAGGSFNADYDIDSSNALSFKGSLHHVWGDAEKKSMTSYYNNSIQNDSLLTAQSNGKDYYLYNFGNINYRRTEKTLAKNYLDISFDYNQFKQENNFQGAFHHLDITQKPMREPDLYNNHLPQHFLNLSQRVEYVIHHKTDRTFTIGIQNSDTRVKNDLVYTDFDRGTRIFLLNANLSNNYRYKEHYNAAYLAYKGNLSQSISFTTALRLERTNYVSEALKNYYAIDTSYTNVFPSIAISYSKKKSNNIVSLSYAKKIIRPNIELLFPGRIYYTDRYFKENNPFLQPVLSNIIELNYSFQGKYNISINYTQDANQFSYFLIPSNENGNTAMKSTVINYGKSRSLSSSINANNNFFNKRLQVQTSAMMVLNNFESQKENITFNITNINMRFWENITFTLSKKKNILAFSTLSFASPFRDVTGSTTNSISSVDLGFRKKINTHLTATIVATDIYNGRSRIEKTTAINGKVQNSFEVANNYTWSFLIRLRYTIGNTKIKRTTDRAVANEEIKQRT